MPSKKAIRKSAQKVHFRNRVKERLGYSLTEDEIDNRTTRICTGELQEIVSHLPSLKIYEILINNRPCVVLYDSETKELVTFLTLSMWQDRKLANSPKGQNVSSLREAIADSPVGEVLRKLKETK